jgi:catechol 2,3-dioxygenase-like lactoylglutathione lyase family enzyme
MTGPFAQVRVLVTPEDYDTSLAFWADVVGLEVVEAFDDGGGALLALGAGALLELLREGGADPGGARLAAEVDDALAWYQRLAEAGAAVGDPAVQPWGHRSFTVRDPGGMIVTLFEVLD